MSPRAEVFEVIANLIPVVLLAGVVRSMWRLNDEQGSARNFMSGAFFLALILLAEVFSLVVIAYPQLTDFLAPIVFAALAISLMLFVFEIVDREAAELWPEEKRTRRVQLVALPLLLLAVTSPVITVLIYLAYRVLAR